MRVVTVITSTLTPALDGVAWENCAAIRYICTSNRSGSAAAAVVTVTRVNAGGATVAPNIGNTQAVLKEGTRAGQGATRLLRHVPGGCCAHVWDGKGVSEEGLGR